MKKQLTLALAITLTLIACEEKGGGIKTVKIGNQTWMAENLNIDLPGSKCYKNDPANCQKYGRLYDWNTAMKACPSGWHLPNNGEWETIVNSAGGKETAGKYLKATSGWIKDPSGNHDNLGDEDPDYDEEKTGNGTDKFGFSALPGGDSSGYDFGGAGWDGRWWSASEYEGNNAQFDFAYSTYLSYYYETMLYGNGSYNNKSLLFSVRCIKD